MGREWEEICYFYEIITIKGLRKNLLNPCFYLVPGAGIEPARYSVPRDFKSLASTISATRASWIKSSDI
jgi:hypothetical protein